MQRVLPESSKPRQAEEARAAALCFHYLAFNSREGTAPEPGWECVGTAGHITGDDTEKPWVK